MTDRLNTFIETHPTGWDHDQWLSLLAELEQEGVDVSEPAEVGLELERARTAWELRRRAVPGLGPKRVDALVDRFPTFWSLRNATAEQIGEIKTIPAALAEKVFGAIQQTD